MTRLDYQRSAHQARMTRAARTADQQERTPRTKAFPARYASICAATGDQIEPGQLIRTWSRTTHTYAHLTCTTQLATP